MPVHSNYESGGYFSTGNLEIKKDEAVVGNVTCYSKYNLRAAICSLWGGKTLISVEDDKGKAKEVYVDTDELAFACSRFVHGNRSSGGNDTITKIKDDILGIVKDETLNENPLFEKTRPGVDQIIDSLKNKMQGGNRPKDSGEIAKLPEARVRKKAGSPRMSRLESSSQAQSPTFSIENDINFKSRIYVSSLANAKKNQEEVFDLGKDKVGILLSNSSGAKKVKFDGKNVSVDVNSLADFLLRLQAIDLNKQTTPYAIKEAMGKVDIKPSEKEELVKELNSFLATRKTKSMEEIFQHLMSHETLRMELPDYDKIFKAK